ncbi:MAG: HK97 family phage prohead protease [Gemmatimonadaceae bacterium]|nr:HK97 family phage prohead protease [Gemmatimonadaceae bacterium]
MAYYVEGLSSTWDLDQGGDLIERGAYRRTLEHWSRRRSDRPIPLVDTHDYSSIRRIIGHLVDAAERAEGLWTRFKLIDGDEAAEAAYRRFDAGAITGLSVGYSVVRQRAPNTEERAAGIRRVLLELKLSEVSAVTFPMNSAAVITRLTSGAKTRFLILEKVQAQAERARVDKARQAVERTLSRRRA